MQAGAVDLLWAVVHDDSVPLLARSRAAQVFHVLACSADGLKVTTIERVAEMLVRCVCADPTPFASASSASVACLCRPQPASETWCRTCEDEG